MPDEPPLGQCRQVRTVLLRRRAPSPPAVDVRKGEEHATVDVLTGEVLAGQLPPRVLRAVQSLLADNREAAIFAFNETLAHQFPGTLEAETEASDD